MHIFLDLPLDFKLSFLKKKTYMSLETRLHVVVHVHGQVVPRIHPMHTPTTYVNMINQRTIDNTYI